MTGLDVLLPKAPGPAESWRYGTVMAVSPLRVLLDGDTDVVNSTPTTLAVVAVGDRVRCHLRGRTMVVTGVVSPAPYVPPPVDHAAAYLGGPLSIPNVTPTTLTGFSMQDATTAGLAYTGGVWTINHAGVWLLQSTVSWATAVGAGYRQAVLHTPYGGGIRVVQGNIAAGQQRLTLTISHAFRLAVGDQVSISVYHNSGSTEQVEATYTTAELTWLGN